MNSGKQNKSRQSTKKNANSSLEFSTINASDFQNSSELGDVITHGGEPEEPGQFNIDPNHIKELSNREHLQFQEMMMAQQMQEQQQQQQPLTQEQQSMLLLQQHMDAIGQRQQQLPGMTSNDSIQMVQSVMLDSSLMNNPDQTYGTMNLSNVGEGYQSKSHQHFQTPQQQFNQQMQQNTLEQAMDSTQMGTHTMNSPSYQLQQQPHFNGPQSNSGFVLGASSSKKRPSQQQPIHFNHSQFIQEEDEEDKDPEGEDDEMLLLPQKQQFNVAQRSLGNGSKTSMTGSFRDQNVRQDQAYARMGGIGGVNQGQHQSGQKVTVTRSQLAGVMKSKLDIYNILTKEGQMYLPPISDCPMDFIKDVLMGRKKVYNNSDIKLISVPNFEELSAKNIFEQVKNYRPDMKLYLPDVDHLIRPLNREYLFNVINTVDESFFIENIRHGYEIRKIRHSDKNQTKLEMDANLFQLLMSSNQIVHNRGRALAYLGNNEKKRKAGGGIEVEKLVRHQYKRKCELGVMKQMPISFPSASQLQGHANQNHGDPGSNGSFNVSSYH